MVQHNASREWHDLLERRRVHRKFEPGASYRQAADAVDVAVFDEDCQGEWVITDVLRTFRSVRTRTFAGLSLYGVRERLLPLVRGLGVDQGQERVDVEALLLATARLAIEQPGNSDAPNAFATIMDLCREIGPMKVGLRDGAQPSAAQQASAATPLTPSPPAS
jgi:hypothetical protein